MIVYYLLIVEIYYRILYSLRQVSMPLVTILLHFINFFRNKLSTFQFENVSVLRDFGIYFLYKITYKLFTLNVCLLALISFCSSL